MREREHLTVSRRRLSPIDIIDYERMAPAPDDLFLQVARICCDLGRFPRKEMHESFAAAELIHKAFFPMSTIVVDAAAGHGLTGLLLLLLDPKRVCLAVDKDRPLSALLLTEAFDEKWPDCRISKRYRYVEGDLRLVTPLPGTLLISIHGCGSLSDVVLSKAIETSSDLCLVPCCQSGSQYRSRKTRLSGRDGPLLLFRHHPKAEEEAAIHYEKMSTRFRSVPTAVDAARVSSLRSSGYRVEIQKLPEGITGRSRVILASKIRDGNENHCDPEREAVGVEALSFMWPERKLPDSPWTTFKSNTGQKNGN